MKRPHSTQSRSQMNNTATDQRWTGRACGIKEKVTRNFDTSADFNAQIQSTSGLNESDFDKLNQFTDDSFDSVSDGAKDEQRTNEKETEARTAVCRGSSFWFPETTVNKAGTGQTDEDASETSTNGGLFIYKNPLWGEEASPDPGAVEADSCSENQKKEHMDREEKLSTANGDMRQHNITSLVTKTNDWDGSCLMEIDPPPYLDAGGNMNISSASGYSSSWSTPQQEPLAKNDDLLSALELEDRPTFTIGK